MIEEYSDDEMTSEEWTLFVAQGLSFELADDREDIHTLADGTPIVASEFEVR